MTANGTSAKVVLGRLLAAGRTKEELAAALGASVRTVERWAAGETTPSSVAHLRALERLAGESKP